MKQFESKKKIGKIIYSKIVILLSIIILFFISSSVFDLYFKYKANVHRLSDAQEKIANLQSKKESLEKENVELETDLGKEEQLRIKYLLAKDGEQAVFFLDESEKEVEKVIEEKSFLDNIFDKISIFD